MKQSEVALICSQLRMDFEAMRYVLNGSALEEGHYVLIRACIGHITDCREQLAKLVGDANADRLLCIVYCRILKSEMDGRDALHV